jgi:tetratricopeptide (TPR) repeat protein
MLSEQGRHQEAIQYLEAAIAIDPANAASHFNRGLCLQELGQFADAAASYEQVATHLDVL